jgi:Tol biopolymer transport system component
MKQPKVNGNRRITDARPVTSKEDGEFIMPRWSPDGLELLFSRPGHNGLYTKGVDGGLIKQVTDREGVGFRAKYTANGDISTNSNDGESQTFKPDGAPADSVAFEKDTSMVGTFTKDDTVYYRAAPGEAPRAITDANDRYFGGVVSPDGKYIAYNGLHTGIYVAPLDGSSPPVNIGEGNSPSFLPDGSGVAYFVSRDDGHNIIGSDIYLSSTDGQNVSNLTQTEGTSEVEPSISPDGTRVAYEVDGQVYVGQLR